MEFYKAVVDPVYAAVASVLQFGDAKVLQVLIKRKGPDYRFWSWGIPSATPGWKDAKRNTVQKGQTSTIRPKQQDHAAQ